MSGAARDFQIKVTTLDQSGPGLDRVDKALSRFDQPIKKMNAGLTDVTRMSRFDKMATAFRDVGGEARNFSDIVAGLVPSLGALTVGGVVAGGVAITRTFATAGAEIKRTAEEIGITEEMLQTLRGAAGFEGLDPSSVTEAWKAFGDVLNNIRFRGDQQGALLFRKLRIGIPSREEELTPERMRQIFDQVADALPKFDALSRRQVANMTGLSSILPLIMRGADHVHELEQRFIDAGGVMDPITTEKAKRLDQSLKGLGQSATAAGNAIGSVLSPALEGASDRTAVWLEKVTALAKALDAGKQGDAFGAARGVFVDPAAWFINKIARGGAGLDLAEWIRGGPAAATPSAAVPTPLSPAAQFNRDEFERMRRLNGASASGPDGSLTIRLKFEGQVPPGLRATTEQSGRTDVEHFMPPDALP